jgi:hypothetical protein
MQSVRRDGPDIQIVDYRDGVAVSSSSIRSNAPIPMEI